MAPRLPHPTSSPEQGWSTRRNVAWDLLKCGRMGGVGSGNLTGVRVRLLSSPGCPPPSAIPPG